MTSLLEKFRVGDKVTMPKSPVAQVHSNALQVGIWALSATHALWAWAARQESDPADSGFVTLTLAIHGWLALAGPRGGWCRA